MAFEKQRETAKKVFRLINTIGIGAIVGGAVAITTRNACTFNQTLNVIGQACGFVSSFALSDAVTDVTGPRMDNIVDTVFDLVDPTITADQIEEPTYTVIN